MKTKIVSITLIAAMGLGLAGCANKQDAGVATGAVLGGLLGSQFGQGGGAIAATIGGALIGGFLGGAIGHSMDKADQAHMMQALNSSPTGRPVSWRNPDSGNYYQVTPTRTSFQGNGQPCREYTSTATIGGKRQQIYGTACRQADGSWQVSN